MRHPVLTPLVSALSVTLAAGALAAPARAVADQQARISDDVACQNLLNSYITRGVAQVGPYGWGGDIRYGTLDTQAAPSTTASAKGGTPSPEGATSSATGTNVQEAGVDESDRVKTNGQQLFRIRGGTLESWDVTGSTPRRLASVNLPGLEQAELLLVGHQLLAFGSYTPMLSKIASGWQPSTASTRVFQYDVTNPGSPKLTRQWRYDSEVASARLYGNTVRFVLRKQAPQLDFVQPDGNTGVLTATDKNQAVVRASTIDAWLPTVSTVDASGNVVSSAPAVSCSGVQLPVDPNADLGTTAIVTLDLTAPAAASTSGPAATGPAPTSAPNGVGLATIADTDYSSTDRLFLATSPGFFDCCIMFRNAAPASSELGVTRLYSFALNGTTTTYVAQGGVRGYVRDRWSMDFAKGVLRLGVGATEATGNASSLVTMTEENGALVRLARITGLGRNQDLKAMRWFDDIAYLVTFRQIDPLYVLDLSDPAQPVLRGKLKIPGYSDYLHPLGSKRLIGLGVNVKQNRNIGAQSALFNVSDMNDPRQLSTVHYPEGSQAPATWDPRQFLWLAGPRAAFTVIAKDWSNVGWVSVLRPRGGALKNTLLPIRKGGSVTDVRTIGLPGDKVALVTTSGVQFLDWR